MPSSTIYLLRHAESAPSEPIAEADWPLSDTGQAQARIWADRLWALFAGAAPPRVISSPYRRAIDTVQPLCDRMRLKVSLEPDLRERVGGHADGIGFDFPMRRAWEDFDFALPGGESNRVCQTRVVDCVRRLATGPDGVLLLSSHGLAITLFLNHVEPSFDLADWRAMRNPDLFKVRLDGAEFSWDRTFRLSSEGI